MNEVTSKVLKGMIVEVYRNSRGSDCTNGGVSSKANQLLLVGEGIPEIFEGRDLPVVKLVSRNLVGNEIYMHVQPIEGSGYMAGGNFCYTCDSRFPCDYPLAIHDRRERR